MFRKIIICFILTVSCFVQLSAQSTRDLKKELKGLKNIQDTIVLNQKINALASGSEEDLMLLTQYGLNKGWSRSQWDELAAKRMPKEQFAFNKAQEKFFAEKDLNKKLAILASLKKEFPNQKYGYIYALIVGDYARAGNFNQAMAYLQKTKDQDRVMAWSQLALVNDPKISKQVTLRVNQTLSQKNLPAEERVMLLNMKRYLLEQKQDYKNAAIIAKKILDLTPNPTQNEMDHYNILLSKSGNYRAAFPALKKMINKETEDEEVKSEYKRAYQFMYPNRDVKAHLDSIEISRVKQYEAKYKDYKGENLIKEKAPEFELLDANGNTVSLKDFRDKIMVIDFWATWCMPCKAALPGMQMLVDKYKNDPEVKFLFIHTKEITGETFEKVKNQSMAYFKAHDFTLPLYVDLRTKDTKQNKVAESFKVGGIPHKFIIDRNGFIRLSSVGFSGSTPDLVAEMTAVIEKVKKLN
ncbi:Thiol-disulfide isomerase or thioredoxin [Pedobacter suwonensis]|uniref:Thiol-disulfide isomerase or thioredoxin n=1 Tax=Pedobacter suwonensis TaxID=332999 RepID=A0A1I0SMT3_9SPHI|nr:TlpA disulfide reductase family protein [Pedobacter suwonensis]SFA40792.1 Thiol-disulfide isomerase or thioredoxin [Pedobacter suwonensis]